tara:strand:- start:93 stop:986 length:894 start_codon:yes stop_codon:yes gene_type:complete
MGTTIIKKIKKNDSVKNFFRSKIGRILKRSFIFRIIEQSAGNWRYPFILFSWWLAKILVPRRKVKINGITFTLTCTNWITHFRWYLFKTKEPETISFIDNYLVEDDIFFDIGANVGVFTIYAAKKNKNIKVYSFEPEASNLAMLKENIINNGIINNTLTYGIGISDSVGLSKLHLQDLTPGSALHTEDKNNIRASAEGNIPIVWKEGIYVITLDYFCDAIKVKPNVIKIDTDGNEGKILKGASNVLKSPLLKAIILEMPLDQKDDCTTILLQSGFKLKEHGFSDSRNQIWVRDSNKE